MTTIDVMCVAAEALGCGQGLGKWLVVNSGWVMSGG